MQINMLHDAAILRNSHNLAEEMANSVAIVCTCYDAVVLVDILARDTVNPPLAAGEIVTTGALMRALPVSAGDTCTTELTGVGLDGICVRFA